MVLHPLSRSITEEKQENCFEFPISRAAIACGLADLVLRAVVALRAVDFAAVFAGAFVSAFVGAFAAGARCRPCAAFVAAAVERALTAGFTVGDAVTRGVDRSSVDSGARVVERETMESGRRGPMSTDAATGSVLGSLPSPGSPWFSDAVVTMSPPTAVETRTLRVGWALGRRCLLMAELRSGSPPTGRVGNCADPVPDAADAAVRQDFRRVLLVVARGGRRQ